MTEPAPPNPQAPPTPPSPPATKPTWLTDAHWDPTAGAIRLDEFGKHYGELATFHKTETEKRAALPAKPEDYKLEVKLPDTVKVPDGFQVKIDEKDPRVPILRNLAHKYGFHPDAVNALVALDAEQKIAAHNAEAERVAGEMKALGDKAKDRIAAVENWGKGLVSKGEITNEEYEEIRAIGASAAGVSLLEKLIAKANGKVPGAGGDPPPPPQPKRLADVFYPNQKAG